MTDQHGSNLLHNHMGVMKNERGTFDYLTVSSTVLNRFSTCLHRRDGWTHCNIFVAVWPLVCQPPPVPDASAENLVRWASLQSCRPCCPEHSVYIQSALRPGSLPDYIQSESNTKLFKKFSKLTCLHSHFNSFIYFIVCRNMKCPSVYFVGGQ